jgi:predicted enzyme related to lactoylglutathione lyase
MNRVVHFEIHAAQPERIVDFYSKLFGWKFDKYPGGPTDYWLITTGESGPENTGINGGLVRRMGVTPKPSDPTPVVAYVCTIDVADIDKTGAAILAAGGTLAHEKSAIPGMAWLAYYKDPDSNIFGIYQTDPNAK